MNELFIPFFVLVDEVTKNEDRLRDFLCNVFRLQGKTGTKKMKNNKQTNKQTNYYVISLFFITFVNKNEKRDEKLRNWAILKNYSAMS